MGWMIRRWRLVKPSTADIGCSVAAGSTVSPVVVIRDAARKSMVQINEELTQLAEDARARASVEEEQINRIVRWIPFGRLLGLIMRLLFSSQRFVRHITGNFQISITERFGVDFTITATTCVNTMLVGAVKDRPMVEDGQVVVRPAAYFTMHFEHGICGAQDVSAFLEECRHLIANPQEVA